MNNVEIEWGTICIAHTNVTLLIIRQKLRYTIRKMATIVCTTAHFTLNLTIILFNYIISIGPNWRQL